MVKFYSILTLYYIAAIIGVFFHRYFLQFIENDFKNNRALRIKKRWALAYSYGIGIWSVYMIHLMGESDLGGQDNSTCIYAIAGSLFLGVLLCAHIVVSLETPRKFHKKRKWK